MTGLAALVLAHNDPAQVRRLITALPEVPVVLHCDVKAPPDVADTMSRGWGSRVRLLPRTSGALNSWSLVRIELAGLRAVLEHSAAEHVAVLSGSDYPLLGVPQLAARLEAWAGRSYLFNAPVPYASWSTPRHPDGGRWRTAHRFFTRGDDLAFVRGVPLRRPWRRALPEGLEVRSSSQWKVYAREDVERLLRIVEERPDLVDFFRTSLVPDESFVASVLTSDPLGDGRRLPDCYAIPWFFSWSAQGAHHPEWLTGADSDAVAAAARGPACTLAELRTGAPARPEAWFARKVSSSRSGDLLDRIDAELLT